MNILFLHPTPGLNRHRAYYHACEVLLRDYGHRAAFVYNGAEREFSGDAAAFNFNRWVEDNKSLVESASIQALSERYAGAEQDALELLSAGDAPRDKNLNPTEHAAWTQLATTVLASDVAILLY